MGLDRTTFSLLDAPSDPASCRRIDLTAELQMDVSGLLEGQATELFLKDLEVIAFDGGFLADESSVFEISGFDLPKHIRDAAESPHQLAPLSAKEISTFRVKGVCSSTVSSKGEVLEVLFQPLDKTAVISKDRTLIFGPERFQRVNDTGLALGTKVAAVYRGGKLRFSSFSQARRLLDLTHYFQEATDDDVVQVLKGPLFVGTHAAAVIAYADQWIRRRFTIIKNSGVLSGSLDAKAIRRGAKKYKVDITVENGKIVFPTTKPAAKGVLRYLSEEYYDGLITGRSYVTNSKRPLNT